MTWSALARMSRAWYLPTVWSHALAAVALSGAVVRPESAGLLIAAFTAFYLGCMILRGAFARGAAAESVAAPQAARGMSVKSVFVVGALLLIVANLVVIATCLRAPDAKLWPAACASLMLTGLGVDYAARPSNRSRPLVIGLCRAGAYVTAAYAVTSWPRAALLEGALGLLSYSWGLGLLSGAGRRTRARMLAPLLLLALPLASLASYWNHGSGPLRVLLVAFGLWTVRAVLLTTGRSSSNRPASIASLWAGVSLWDALMILKADHARWALAALACFVLSRLLVVRGAALA